jgi:hypothetical protein
LRANETRSFAALQKSVAPEKYGKPADLSQLPHRWIALQFLSAEASRSAVGKGECAASTDRFGKTSLSLSAYWRIASNVSLAG